MNCEELFNKGHYEEIINKYSSSTNIDELWFVIDALVQLDKLEQAINFLVENRKIFMKEPKKLMTIHIDLLVTLRKWSEALLVLNDYEELPYISYEVEELFPELKKYIFSRMKPPYEEKDLHELLNSENINEAIGAINQLYDRDLAPFKTKLKEILVDDNKSSFLKSFVLMLLASKKEMDEYVVSKNGLTYELVPYELDPIISKGEIDHLFISKSTLAKDVSMSQSLTQILMQYALFVYPQTIFEEDIYTPLCAAEMVVYEIYNMADDKLQTLMEKNHLNKNNVMALYEIMKEIVNY